MVGAPCDVMVGAHRVSGWGPSGVLGWSLHAVRTVSSRLVQALNDETTADADELGGLAPAGKSPAARAVHVVALAPPATQREHAGTPLPTL